MPNLINRQLAITQRAALGYVKANEGVTTVAAAVALERTRVGMLDTFRSLEDRGLLRWTWPNTPATDSYQWWTTREAFDA